MENMKETKRYGEQKRKRKYLFWTLKEESGENWGKEIIEEIMIENFSEMITDINLIFQVE